MLSNPGRRICTPYKDAGRHLDIPGSPASMAPKVVPTLFETIPTMLPDDAIEVRELKPRPRPLSKDAIAHPALCEECSTFLALDDSIMEPYLETSEDGEPFIGFMATGYCPFPAFGGIDYVRHDSIPSLPALSHAAEGGCRFCAAVKKGLQTKYQGSAWWEPDSDPLILRFQYSWTYRHRGQDLLRTGLNSIVVSVFHTSFGTWKRVALSFSVCAGEGTPLSSLSCDLKY